MLSELRADLRELTQNIILLISKRKNLVGQIQKEKNSIGEFSNFDLDREIIVFNKMSPFLDSFSTKEILAISLLIEEHANQHGRYPEWSQGEHLMNSPQNLLEMINPILLARYDKSRYDLLPINEKFLKILNPVME